MQQVAQRAHSLQANLLLLPHSSDKQWVHVVGPVPRQQRVRRIALLKAEPSLSFFPTLSGYMYWGWSVEILCVTVGEGLAGRLAKQTYCSEVRVSACSGGMSRRHLEQETDCKMVRQDGVRPTRNSHRVDMRGLGNNLASKGRNIQSEPDGQRWLSNSQWLRPLMTNLHVQVISISKPGIVQRLAIRCVLRYELGPSKLMSRP